MAQGFLTADLLKNATADETISNWVDVRGKTHLVFYLSSSGTTSGGAISLEEMLPVGAPGGQVPGLPFSGTNSLITTAINASTFTGGAQVAHHATVGAYGWVRARVSTAITGGGSVSVGLVAV
jgi:hypothetical protein